LEQSKLSSNWCKSYKRNVIRYCVIQSALVICGLFKCEHWKNGPKWQFSSQKFRRFAVQKWRNVSTANNEEDLYWHFYQRFIIVSDWKKTVCVFKKTVEKHCHIYSYDVTCIWRNLFIIAFCGSPPDPWPAIWVAYGILSFICSLLGS
jgi:hypothetical protein